jgi:RNA polymerase sigma-70 factor (ECF subfamily)
MDDSVARQRERSRADASLVAQLRCGGKPRQSVISQLYARYARDFKGYFRRHGASEAQAEDLLQDTFVKVIQSLDGYSGSGAFEAWLWAIARNTMLSEFRSRTSDKASVSLDEQEPEVGERLINRDGGAHSDPADADCVARGLAAFTDRFKEYAHVLERVAVDDWGYEELAQYRNCGAGAAREYLSQCRKRIWEYIGHCYQTGAK